MTAPRTPEKALSEVAQLAPSSVTQPEWLTEGAPFELPPAQDGYRFWECHSVGQMEQLQRAEGISREQVEFLRDQVMRKLERGAQYGGMPVRHWIGAKHTEALKEECHRNGQHYTECPMCRAPIVLIPFLGQFAQQKSCGCDLSAAQRLDIQAGDDRAERKAQRERDLADTSGDPTITAKLAALFVQIPEVEA